MKNTTFFIYFLLENTSQQHPMAGTKDHFSHFLTLLPVDPRKENALFSHTHFGTGSYLDIPSSMSIPRGIAIGIKKPPDSKIILPIKLPDVLIQAFHHASSSDPPLSFSVQFGSDATSNVSHIPLDSKHPCCIWMSWGLDPDLSGTSMVLFSSEGDPDGRGLFLRSCPTSTMD